MRSRVRRAVLWQAPREKQELVAAVGAKLADAVKDGRREFHFSLVRAGVSNAYALPGGFVFITEPLLDLCAQDRDELAFLLGHEMGHVLRGHAKSQLTASTFLHAVTAQLAGAGLMLRQLLNKGYSRELELEADAEGARLAASAGFDPRAAARALQRLARVSGGNAGLMEYFSSIPRLRSGFRRWNGVAKLTDAEIRPVLFSGFGLGRRGIRPAAGRQSEAPLHLAFPASRRTEGKCVHRPGSGRLADGRRHRAP